MNQNITELKNVVTVDQDQIQNHLGEIVRGTVEQTLNSLLDAEADRLCNATRYERSADRLDTRAGSYQRKLHTKAGEVNLNSLPLAVVFRVVVTFCHDASFRIISLSV